MKVSSPNIPVQTIVNKIKREDILFTHKLQRREGVWNRTQKSLLIDSLLRGYLLNPTYTIIEGKKQYVIDGVQRLSTIFDFIMGKYSLSKRLDPIIINEESYEIAGKNFKKLDEKLQDELMSAQIQICEISDYTDKDVREMFRRLNSGKPLNTSQKLTPDMSDELSNAVLDIITLPFWGKVLTNAQLKSSVDLSIVIEIMMLNEHGYEVTSFSKIEREKFIQYYNDNFDKSKIDIIKKSLNNLNENLSDDVKINKTSISFICYAGCEVLRKKKSFSKFIGSVNDFIKTYDTNEEYKSMIQQGTSSAESVRARLDYWNGIVKKL